jgi:replicative DNA helicase
MKLSDIGAERAVLAGLVNYGLESYVEIMDVVSTSTFTDTTNQVIYDCLVKIAMEDGVADIPSIISAAKSLGVDEVISTQNNLEYIAEEC